MHSKTAEFAAAQGLTLTPAQLDLLAKYADLIWQKKDFLNLTSVADKEEIFTRHICDGLAAAAFFNRAAAGKDAFSVADMGSGAGYIGLAVAVALPQAKVSLVESLEKRCSFLNWAVLKLGLKNVSVICGRLGQKPVGTFDFVTERAMGQISDILPLIAPALKAGGIFAAYQSAKTEMEPDVLRRLGLRQMPFESYILPLENKERFFSVFEKQTDTAA